MTRGELCARMDTREFIEWRILDSLAPLGERRADIRVGILASLIANVHRDAKKRRQPFTVHDFAPYLEKPAPALLPASVLLENLRAYQASQLAKAG